MTVKSDLIGQLRQKGIQVVAGDHTIKTLRALLAVMGGPAQAIPKVPKVKIEETKEDKIIEGGVYYVTFDLKIITKNNGYKTRRVTVEYRVPDDGELEQPLLKRLAADYVTKEYHDSEVDIADIEKPMFVLKKDVDLREIRNKNVGMQYKMFPDDKLVNKNPGQCAIDSIMATVHKAWPCFTRDRLIEELEMVAHPEDVDFVNTGITERHIMDWARMKKTVTCIALNPFGIAFDSVTAVGHTDVIFAFLVNNQHIFATLDHNMQVRIAKTKRLDFSEMKYKIGIEQWEYSSLENAMNATAKIVHVETDDLSSLLKEVVMTSGFYPVAIVSRSSFITIFEHPVSHQVFIASQDFLLRKEVCDKSLKETNYIGFVWANQSWAAIFRAWCEFTLPPLPVSYYGKDSMMIRNTYSQTAFIGMTREVSEEERSNITSFDIRKCYTSCLLTNTHAFGIESVFDDIVPFTGGIIPVGKAFVRNSFYLGHAKYSRGPYPSFFVQYAIDEGAIPIEDVTHIQQASRVLAANTFEKLTKHLQEMFPSLVTRILNPGVGAWGSRYVKTGSVAITDSFEVALGMVAQDDNVKLTEVGNSFWFMRKEYKEPLYSGFVGMREHIVCMGHIKLHQMEKQVCDEHTEVIAYNTDSIKVIRPSPTFAPIPKATAKPGDICIEENANGVKKMNLRGRIISTMVDRPEYVHHEFVWTDIPLIEAQMRGPGLMAIGKPGYGKSFLLNFLHQKDEKNEQKSVKLAWTKTAAANIKGCTLDHFFPENCHTSRTECIQKALAFDMMNCDESTIIPEKWWSIYFEIKEKKPDMVFRFFGDPQQLHSEDYEGSKLWFEYHKSKLMHQLVDGNRVTLQYQEGSARYDKQMKSKLDSFEQVKNLNAFGVMELFTPAQCDFNIVKTPQRRTKVNEEWAAHYSLGQKTIPCGDLKLWIGMYLISHKNEAAIVNSTRYKVLELGENVKLCNEEEELTVSYKQIERTCRYGYADTIMRIISRTIHGPFNIHEVTKMNTNEMLVALSRAPTATNIGMIQTTKTYVDACPPPKGEAIVREKALFTGSIYSRTDGTFTYIGSTTNDEKREKQHGRKPVSKKVALWEAQKKNQIQMKVIETYVCAHVRQLVNREYEHIMMIPADQCMNTNGIQKIAKESVSTQVTPVEIDFSRFKITNDMKAKRYRIRWTDSGEKQTKDFWYKVIPQETQKLAAEEFRAALVRQFFI